MLFYIIADADFSVFYKDAAFFIIRSHQTMDGSISAT